MKTIRCIFAALLVLTVMSCDRKPEEIIACGDDQVIIIDSGKSNGENVEILWNWKISEATDLPEKYRKILRPTDECKAVGRDQVLITSSGGGVVLVDRATKKSVFWAHSPMAHSAEMLPNDRVVVALSTHAGGNRIEVYDLDAPEKVVFTDSLYSGHGVVWIDKLECLFALGYNELRRYSLKEWNSDKPSLHLEEKWTLPDNGGHDLFAASESRLLLSTSKSVWSFRIPEGKFTPFEPIASTANIKSVNYNEAKDRLVYTKGEISWWTHNIYCINPDKTIVIPGINIYKARVND